MSDPRDGPPGLYYVQGSTTSVFISEGWVRNPNRSSDSAAGRSEVEEHPGADGIDVADVG